MRAVKEVYKWQIAPRVKTNRDGADLAICNARIISSDSLTVTMVPYSIFKRGTITEGIDPPSSTWCAMSPDYGLCGISKLSRAVLIQHTTVELWTGTKSTSHVINSPGTTTAQTTAHPSCRWCSRYKQLKTRHYKCCSIRVEMGGQP